MAVRKALRELLRDFKRNGLTVISMRQTSNHIHIHFEEFPQTFVVASTPSDRHSYRNALSDAKRLARNHQQENPNVT